MSGPVLRLLLFGFVISLSGCLGAVEKPPVEEADADADTDADTAEQVRWLSGGPVCDSSWAHRTFVAHSDGDVQAFCTVLPGPGGTASLDVMCRRPEATAGSMEALAGQTTADVPGAMSVVMRWTWRSDLADRWLGFRRLTVFKAKFCPQHEVVYLAPGASALGSG